MSEQKVISYFFNDKTPVTKKFIIAYGPPGSGKSSVMKDATQHLRIESDTLIHVDVDSIVKILANKDRMSRIEYENLRPKADNMSDMVLNHALLNDYNILWETTGFSINWTIKEIKRVQRLGYRVHLVYPLVPTDTLISRVQSRQEMSGQVGAPEQRIRRTVEKASKNISYLVPYLDKLFIYDNSGSMDQLHLLLTTINEYNGREGNMGPGWEQHNICDCNNVKELRGRFNDSILEFFESHCCKE